MRINVLKDYETLSRSAADILLSTVKENPKAAIIIATGSTPTLTYQLWVRDLLAQNIPTDNLTIIKLDEWGGLPMDHPSTCETYIRTYIFDPLKLREDQFISFQSQPEVPEQECLRIAQEIQRLRSIDICALGIGKNGHLGFNEPSDTWSTVPFVATLTKESLGHDMLQGDSSKVTFGITLGLNTIRQSKHILVLANGTAKTDIVNTALRGPVTPRCPASILQELPNMTLLLDQEASAKL